MEKIKSDEEEEGKGKKETAKEGVWHPKKAPDGGIYDIEPRTQFMGKGQRNAPDDVKRQL